jgi:pimeloyl-ACP methyl ester carboxylesterase
MGRAALDKLAQSVPNLRDKVIVQGAGHWIQQKRPSEVNAALLAFLAKEDAPDR